jgi:hypothetical protein
VDDLLVPVARDVPHHDLVPGADQLATELGVLARGASHVDHARLPADGLLHQAREAQPAHVLGHAVQLGVALGLGANRGVRCLHVGDGDPPRFLPITYESYLT